MDLELREDHSSDVVLSVDLRAYSLEALKKAAYALGRVSSSRIELLDDATARVVLFPNPGESVGQVLAARFWQELLDQDLRESVGRETGPVRNLIMAHALSKLPLLNPGLESGEPSFEVN